MAAPTFEQRQKEEQAKTQPTAEQRLADYEAMFASQRAIIEHLKNLNQELETLLTSCRDDLSDITRENQGLRYQNRELHAATLNTNTQPQVVNDDRPWYKRLFS
jgi:uncharacterized coiled-coil protein SlyX